MAAISYLFTLIVLSIVAFLFHRYGHSILHLDIYWVPVYVSAGIILFLHLPSIYQVLTDGLIVLPGRIGSKLFVITVSLILQLTVIHLSDSRFWIGLNPSLVAVITILFLIGYDESSPPSVIHFVWYVILYLLIPSFIYVTCFFRKVEVNLRAFSSIKIEHHSVLVELRSEINRLLKIAIQASTALAASLGVAMSILFGQEKRLGMIQVI